MWRDIERHLLPLNFVLDPASMVSIVGFLMCVIGICNAGHMWNVCVFGKLNQPFSTAHRQGCERAFMLEVSPQINDSDVRGIHEMQENCTKSLSTQKSRNRCENALCGRFYQGWVRCHPGSTKARPRAPLVARAQVDDHLIDLDRRSSSFNIHTVTLLPIFRRKEGGEMGSRIPKVKCPNWS